MEATKNYFLTEIELIGKLSDAYYSDLMWEFNRINWDSPLAISTFENYLVNVRMHVNQSY